MIVDRRTIGNVHVLLDKMLKGEFPAMGATPHQLIAARVLVDYLNWQGGAPKTDFSVFLDHAQKLLILDGRGANLQLIQAAYHDDAIRRLPAKFLRLHFGGFSLDDTMTAVRAEATLRLYKAKPIRAEQCVKCGSQHRSHQPHNPYNRHARLLSQAVEGLLPTWEWAIADCPEWSQQAAMPVLMRYGQWRYVGERSLQMLGEIHDEIEKACQVHGG